MARQVVGLKTVCAFLVIAGSVYVVGCNMLAGTFAPGVAGDFGATQGGVQDMGFARELVASGRVPPPEAFVVEGMFSEHDLGLAGDPCDRVLCLRSALGVAPTLDGNPSGWLQIGLSSTIDPDTYERPSVTLIATMDVSGSMGWDYYSEQTEYPTPGQVTRNLLSAIAAELGAQDQIALVTYGTTAETVLPLTRGDQQVTIQAAIDALGTGGVTDMESGLRLAYAIAQVADAQTGETRVMLFSDLQPNVGATEPSEFERIMEEGANRGVGLTVMSVGVGLRQEIVNAITHARGGNAFSLFDDEDAVELMQDDWPFLISPIASDMTVDVTPSAGFHLADSYGFPSGDDEFTTTLDVSSVFLSRRKGALLLRIDPDDGDDLAGMKLSGVLSYLTPEGELVEDVIEATYSDDQTNELGQYFEQANVGKTVALAQLVSEMEQAAERYREEPESAISIARRAFIRFSEDARVLEDETLTSEVEFARELLRLMEAGSEQGNMYGHRG